MINSDRKNINEIRDVALSFREEVNAETENHIMKEEQTVPEKHDDNNDKKIIMIKMIKAVREVKIKEIIL